jgi:hypothetical protein
MVDECATLLRMPAQLRHRAGTVPLQQALFEVDCRSRAEEFVLERDREREEILTDILAAHINDAADEKGWE